MNVHISQAAQVGDARAQLIYNLMSNAMRCGYNPVTEAM